MKGIGVMIRQMAMGNCITQMETFMRGIGKMTRLMAKGPIFMPMELGIRENGRMTSSTGMELKFGLIMLSTKGNISRARRMERED